MVWPTYRLCTNFLSHFEVGHTHFGLLGLASLHYRTVILYPLPVVPTDSSSFGCVLWMPQLSVGQCEELQPTAQHTSSSPNIIRLIQHVPRQAKSGCPHIPLYTNQKAFCPTQFQNILRHLCRHLSLHWTWGPVGHTTAWLCIILWCWSPCPVVEAFLDTNTPPTTTHNPQQGNGTMAYQKNVSTHHLHWAHKPQKSPMIRKFNMSIIDHFESNPWYSLVQCHWSPFILSESLRHHGLDVCLLQLLSSNWLIVRNLAE